MSIDDSATLALGDCIERAIASLVLHVTGSDESKDERSDKDGSWSRPRVAPFLKLSVMAPIRAACANFSTNHRHTCPTARRTLYDRIARATRQMVDALVSACPMSVQPETCARDLEAFLHTLHAVQTCLSVLCATLRDYNLYLVRAASLPSIREVAYMQLQGHLVASSQLLSDAPPSPFVLSPLLSATPSHSTQSSCWGDGVVQQWYGADVRSL